MIQRSHNIPATNASRRRGARPGVRAHRGGVTLIEVLATIMLVAIVMPTIMEGISLSKTVGEAARRRNEASTLAQSKLSELIALGQWQGGGQAGDFGDEAPDYRWSAEVLQWYDAAVSELDVYVTWDVRGVEQRIRMSTLVYGGDPSSGLNSSNSGTSDTSGGTTP